MNIQALQAIVANMRCFSHRADKIPQWADQIEAAVAQAGEQQPVAWFLRTGHGTKLVEHKPDCWIDLWEPLYASPVAQGWQPIATLPRNTGCEYLLGHSGGYRMQWVDATAEPPEWATHWMLPDPPANTGGQDR